MTGRQTEIVVGGAGYAGILATERIAGKLRGQNAHVTLVNAADVFVERLRLHEMAAGQSVQRRPIAEMLRGTGVAFVQGLVTGIDPDQRTLTVQTEGETRALGYDLLLYALGSIIDRDSVPGVREYAYTLTPTGARSVPALREALRNVPTGGRVLVVGGGATGIESAAEFADAYPNVHVELVTRGQFGAFMPKGVAGTMRRSLKRHSVVIHDQTSVTDLTPNAAMTGSGEAIPFDVCLWTGGFAVPALARETGLAVNEHGQILVDPFMRSLSHPTVYAAGDAAHPLEEPGNPVRMSAVTAIFMGARGGLHRCLGAKPDAEAVQLRLSGAGDRAWSPRRDWLQQLSRRHPERALLHRTRRLRVPALRPALSGEPADD